MAETNSKNSKYINLLPKEEQRELKLELLSRRLIFFWTAAILSLVVFVVLAEATSIYLNNSVHKVQTNIDKDNQVLNSSDYRDLQDQILALNKNIREIKNLTSQHYYWSNSLIALSDLIPPNMQLNEAAFSSNTGKIQVNGQAQTRESVLDFWAKVTNSDKFNDINFPLNNLEKAKLSDFNFTFAVDKTKFKTP